LSSFCGNYDPPDDGNYLLKHVGENLEPINKSYYYLDAFVGYFTAILQNARSNYPEVIDWFVVSADKCLFFQSVVQI
jgi:hypothetical protein